MRMQRRLLPSSLQLRLGLPRAAYFVRMDCPGVQHNRLPGATGSEPPPLLDHSLVLVREGAEGRLLQSYGGLYSLCDWLAHGDGRADLQQISVNRRRDWPAGPARAEKVFGKLPPADVRLRIRPGAASFTGRLPTSAMKELCVLLDRLSSGSGDNSEERSSVEPISAPRWWGAEDYARITGVDARRRTEAVIGAAESLPSSFVITWLRTTLEIQADPQARMEELCSSLKA